eukprot:3504548-Pyramimonas_sp.AAC.1
MGPRNAVLGVADACIHPHWGFRRSSEWGHETATKRGSGCCGCMWSPPLGPQVELCMGPRNAVLGVADA